MVSNVVGSAAVPFFFPPMNLSRFGLNNLLMDGGTTWNLNMESGIKECFKLEGITDESQIIVDVIDLEPDQLPLYPYNSTEREELSARAAECLDIAKNNPQTLTSTEHADCTWHIMPLTVQNYLRKKEIHNYFAIMNDIVEFMQAHDKVNYRYFVQPTQALLPEYLLLDFSYKNTKRAIEIGMQDMQAAIEMGPGRSFDKVRNKTVAAEFGQVM